MVENTLNLPDWLTVSGEVRARHQFMKNQFRPGFPDDDDHILALRSLLDIKVRFSDAITFGAEMQDGRFVGADDATPLSTGFVNTFELLRAYAMVTGQDVFGAGGESTLTFGRMTLALGRGRLIGRNGFRNTINAFTGIHYEWSKGNQKLDAFWVLPVDRQPSTRADLLANKAGFDRENLARQLWAIHWEQKGLPWGLKAQVYMFGLHERDRPDLNTRNRQIYTPGFALFKSAKPNEWFVDLEMSANFGHSNKTAAVTDTQRLDHFGYTAHAEIGYRFDAPWTPMLLAQFDFASGDADPNDNKNGQYDTLFGPKRGDFGHTDIYGAFARENIIAPAVALHLWPTDSMHARIRYQPGWLEEARDIWPDIGVVDFTGQSGTFIGHQVETRFTWDLAGGHVRLGAGSAFLFKGRFAREAPNANDNGDSIYLYSDVTLKF
ncbi:MAG: alginate export family protein [Pseudomonadota bacterium]